MLKLYIDIIIDYYVLEVLLAKGGFIMDLRLAHGLNEGEIGTYINIITTDKYSIAEYKTSTERKMSSFDHTHEAYEFIIPFNTIPLLRYQNAIYIGEVGYCYPVNPYTRHGIEFELNSNLISLVFDMKYLDSVKNKLGFEGKYFYTKFLVSKELIRLLKKFKEKQTDELMTKVLETIIKDGLKADVDARRPEKVYFVSMKESILYMMDNYLNPDLTIKDIASHSAYAYTYYTKAFKKYMHDTPVNHLNKLRLSKAKELMQNSSLSIEEIAKLCGFRTQSNFSEAFKRIVGINPAEYRKKYL